MKSITQVLLVVFVLGFSANASRADEPLLGEIRMFAGNFAPRGWAFCDGQLIQISQNSALFSLLGTTYGGDGRDTFALPDLRGRAPIHAGTPLGMLEVKQGAKGGNIGVLESGKAEGAKTTPTLGVRYIIAVQGTFPSRI